MFIIRDAQVVIYMCNTCFIKENR